MMNLVDHTPLRTLQVQARRGAELMDRVRPGWYLCINLWSFKVTVAWHPVLERFLRRIIPNNHRKYGFFGNSRQDDEHLTRLWKLHMRRRIAHKARLDARPFSYVPDRTSQGRVKRGAELMDRLIPSWYRSVDLETFDIAALDNDVIGQLDTKHVFSRVLKERGFMGENLLNDVALNRLWTYHIKKRIKQWLANEYQNQL